MCKTKTKPATLSEWHERVAEDLQNHIIDAQGLVKKARTASGEAVDQIMQAARDALCGGIDTLSEALRESADTLREHGEDFREKTIDYSQGIDEQVRENPWKFIGIAALGGFVLRMLRDRD